MKGQETTLGAPGRVSGLSQGMQWRGHRRAGAELASPGCSMRLRGRGRSTVSPLTAISMRGRMTMAKITLPGSGQRRAVASVRPPIARDSSLDSGGGEKAIDRWSNVVEDEGGRNGRKARRGEGRVLCVPDNVDPRLGESSTEEAIGPEDA